VLPREERGMSKCLKCQESSSNRRCERQSKSHDTSYRNLKRWKRRRKSCQKILEEAEELRTKIEAEDEEIREKLLPEIEQVEQEGSKSYERARRTDKTTHRVSSQSTKRSI
jgi:hypothetical protein